ncbi:MAG: hypothetical protein GC185_08510 [Alphaproteobacteria bacterium]|nr:hypothetical protein [Alphaproteobacteria bacterium]
MKRALLTAVSLVFVVALAAGLYLFFSPLPGAPVTQHKIAMKDKVLYERLWAGAKMGGKKAQFKLGRLLASGELGFTDMEKAAVWMKKSADKDYGPAQLYMARFAFLGEGGEKDLAAGADWVRKAAGNNVPNADGLMGMLYLGGIGVKQDFAQALDWLKKSDTPEAAKLAGNIQKSLDDINALPAEEKDAAMNRFATGYRFNIGHSFVKTLDELRKSEDAASAADNDNGDKADAAQSAKPEPQKEQPEAKAEDKPETPPQADAQPAPAPEQPTDKTEQQPEQQQQNSQQGEQQDGH